MKLFVLKVISLAVFLVGALILGAMLHIAQAVEASAKFNSLLANQDTMELLLWIAGGAMFLLGGYGFLPKLPKSRGKRFVSYEEEYGNVVLDLDPAERTLNKIIRNLPEVKKAQIHIRRDEDGQRVLIRSTAVLNAQLGVTAKETRDFVNWSIVETATTMLGLDVVTPIDQAVKQTSVDTAAAGDALHSTAYAEAEAEPEPVNLESQLEEAGMPAIEEKPEAPEPEPAEGGGEEVTGQTEAYHYEEAAEEAVEPKPSAHDFSLDAPLPAEDTSTDDSAAQEEDDEAAPFAALAEPEAEPLEEDAVPEATPLDALSYGEEESEEDGGEEEDKDKEDTSLWA